MRGLKVTVVLAGLLALVLPQSAGAYPGPTLPGLTTVLPWTPGGEIEVRGSNFEPGCTVLVRVLILADYVDMGSGVVNPDGTADFNFLAPTFSQFSNSGGTIVVEMVAQSPCNPEYASYALVATLPPTL